MTKKAVKAEETVTKNGKSKVLTWESISMQIVAKQYDQSLDKLTLSSLI